MFALCLLIETSLKSLRLRKLAYLGYLWLPNLTFDYLSLPLVTFPSLWLPFLTYGYLSLPLVTFPYLLLPFRTLGYLSVPFLTFPHLSLPFLTFTGPYWALLGLILHLRTN